MHRKLILLLAVPTLALSACGGSDSDSDKIKDIINDVAKDPGKACDNVNDALLKQVGGKDKCKDLAKDEKGGDVKINSVDVKGDKATAKIKDKDGDQTVEFEKVDGDWKLSG